MAAINVRKRTDILNRNLDNSRRKSNLSRSILVLSRICCAAVLLLLCACGGHSQINRLPQDGAPPPPHNPPPPAPITITAAQVIPSQPATWTFSGLNGCQMVINISPAPVTDFIPPNSLRLTADKNGTNCYWNPGTPGAHLDAALATHSDGSINYIAFLITFPQSCNFCNGWTYMTADITPDGDGKIPYLIVPASATTGIINTVDTDYIGYSLSGTDPSILTFNSILTIAPSGKTHWRTTSTIENVATPSYSGPSISVEVFEGPCFRADGTYFADVSCNHEKMYWAPGAGFVKNMVFSIGAGELTLPDGSHNPVYDMQR